MRGAIHEDRPYRDTLPILRRGRESGRRAGVPAGDRNFPIGDHSPIMAMSRAGSSDLRPFCETLLMIKFRFVSAAICGIGLAVAACHSPQPQITYNSLVGTYAYKSQDPENRSTDHDWIA